MLGKWTVRGCLFFFSLGFALAARAFVGVASPRLVGAECVDQGVESCLLKNMLKSEHRSLEMAVDEDQNLVARLSSENVTVEADLAERVASGELTDEQSAEIARDLGRLDGMSYRVPSVDVLKQDLGFPKESEIEAVDLIDLVRAHLQVVFGMSAISAAYLADRLGVQAAQEETVR